MDANAARRLMRKARVAIQAIEDYVPRHAQDRHTLGVGLGYWHNTLIDAWDRLETLGETTFDFVRVDIIPQPWAEWLATREEVRGH